MSSQTRASVNDYIVGAQLDEAIAAGQELVISWPFIDGGVKDWTQAEAIWLFNPLILRTNVDMRICVAGNTYFSPI